MPKPDISFLKDYRQALYALLIGFLLLAVLSWQLNFKKTFNLWKANQKYKERLEASVHSSSQIPLLEKQKKQMEASALRTYDRDLLLEKVSEFCKNNKMLLLNFPETERHDANNIVYMTNLIEVQGSYKDILQLAYLLEYSERMGAVVSLKFNRVEDRMEKKTWLRGSIILRNIDT